MWLLLEDFEAFEAFEDVEEASSSCLRSFFKVEGDFKLVGFHRVSVEGWKLRVDLRPFDLAEVVEVLDLVDGDE